MKNLLNKILNWFKPKTKFDFHYDPLAIDEDVYPIRTIEQQEKLAELDAAFKNGHLVFEDYPYYPFRNKKTQEKFDELLVNLGDQAKKAFKEELEYREKYDVFIDMRKK